MCPDMEQLEEHLKLKNGYENKDHRISFSIMSQICDDEIDKTCKSSKEIERLLSYFFFTVYYLEEKADFESHDTHNDKPLYTQDSFHS